MIILFGEMIGYMTNVYPPLYTLIGEVIKEVDSVIIIYQGHIISNDDKDDKDNANVNNDMPVLLRKCRTCALSYVFSYSSSLAFPVTRGRRYS